MKTDTPVGLTAIVLLLVLALPAQASDYTLGIFGNANEDDTINMQDVTYTELIILEYRDKTDLADGKYDGKINMQDVTQIELIILGREKELTIVDSAERTVTVKKPIITIVFLSHTSTEAIKSVGAEDRVVGVEQSVVDKKVFFPELSNLPVVKSGSTPDYEQILDLKPDIVVAYGFSTSKYADKLEPHITVVGLNFYKPKTMTEEVRKLGYLLGKNDEADEFIDFYEGYVDEINVRIEELSEDDKLRVYLEGGSDYTSVGEGSGGNDLCIMAGGINIAAELPGAYPKIDPEWVIEQNPPIMVKTVNHHNVVSGYEVDDLAEIEIRRDAFMNRPGWMHIAAVENGRVYMISDSVYTKPAFFVGIAYMAKWFYPELFEDLDPKEIHQQYLTEFQGLEYDLDEHGVFGYPPFEES